MIRFRIAFSILTYGLFICFTTSSFAAPSYAQNCDYYDNQTAAASESGLQSLLLALPESSAIIICQPTRSVDGIFILYPIFNRNGVSFFRRSYFEVPSGSLENARNVDDLLDDGFIRHNTMMALGANGEMSHKNLEFVETRLIPPGTFKRFYIKWKGYVDQPQNLRSSFDDSKLDSENKALYAELSQSLNDNPGSKIYSISFDELDIAEGDGRELRFYPRYIVIISTRTQMWRIDFDVPDSQRFMLLGVEKAIEVIGAR